MLSAAIAILRVPIPLIRKAVSGSNSALSTCVKAAQWTIISGFIVTQYYLLFLHL